MIVSRHNRKIKNIRRHLRCKGDFAILEGPHLVAEALTAEIALLEVLATPEFVSDAASRKLMERLGNRVSLVDARLIEELCDAETPRGILAVASLPRPGVEAVPIQAAARYLFVDGLQDPGNLGALARVAEAFGVAAMVLGCGCAHPNHPRALRASAGSLLRIPAARETTADDLRRHLGRLSPAWLALVPRGGTDVADISLPGALVLAVGAEGPGLSREITSRADWRVTIPVNPPVESLNAVVAAALALYVLERRT